MFVADLNIFGYTMREFMVDGGTCMVAVVVVAKGIYKIGQ